MNIEELRAAYEQARDRLHAVARALDDPADDADLDALQRELSEAADEAERTKRNLDEAERLQRVLADHPLPQPNRGQQSTVRVLSEPRTYRQHGPHSFFADAFNASGFGGRMPDPRAMARIQRHIEEMEAEGLAARERDGAEARDVGTGAFAGLTIPQFLIDLYAPLARAGRPFANSCRLLPLPESGMVISISKITTGTSVAEQASENDAVSETNIDDTKLDVDVRTYAGMQDVSRQALERSELVDVVVFGDLVEAYHAKVDAAILNDDGTSGKHKGLRNATGLISVTYTDASPTVGEAYPKFSDAIQQVNSNRFLPASAIWMHPRRWGWFTAALDTTNRPLVVPVAPMNPVGVGQAAEYGQVVGQIQGLPVITDANILTNLGAGTNEDEVYIGRAADFLLWEEGDGMPRRLRFEQTLGGNLTIKLVVYGYSAFTAERYPKAGSKIGGTGFVAPTF